VAIADLDEAQFSLGGMFLELGKPSQAVGTEYTPFDHAKGARPGPGHAFQKTAAVNAIMIVVVQDLIGHLNLASVMVFCFLHCVHLE
jgi:hypothetical protein